MSDRARRLARRSARGRWARRAVAAVVAAAVANCAPPRPAPSEPPVVGERVVYAPARQPWLLPPERDHDGVGDGVGRGIGRGVASLRLAPLAVVAAPEVEERLEPLRAPAIWQLPARGDEPALAAVAGSDSQGSAIELIDIDAGVVRWRVREPSGPIVGVTAEAIVGADRGTWALDREGGVLWHTTSAFAAMADALVVVAGSLELVSVLEAGSGRELWRSKLPDALLASDARWACLGGELLLLDERGGLHRLLLDAKTAEEARAAWRVDGGFESVEGCRGPVIAATHPAEDGSYQLWRIARESGEVLAKLGSVRGHWLEDDGALVVATDAGVWRYGAKEGERRLLTPAPLGARVARAGARALVQVPSGLAILEADGRVQPLAAKADSAALGARALLTGSWSGSPAHTVARAALPSAGEATDEATGDAPVWGSWGRVARAARPPLAPAPLVDLGVLRAAATPAPTPLTAAAAAEPGLVVAVGTGVVAVLRAPTGPALVRYELDGVLQWSSPRGCRGERPLALAATAERVLCLGLGEAGRGEVVASDAESGAALWEKTAIAEELEVRGEVALLRGADRATLLRLSDGAELGSWRSADGGRVRAALIEAGGATLVVAEEAGAVVARWPLAAMLPLWSVAVAGDVAEVQGDGERALVSLVGGAAYSLRGEDGAAFALGGEADVWRACAEGLLAITRSDDVTRVALYARDGASRWAYDLALPGEIAAMVSAVAGGSALLYGDARERALPFDARGLGEPIVLPEAAAGATWVRPLTSGVARWAGVSTTTPRWWAF